MPDPANKELTEARINIGRLQVEVEHLNRSMEDLQESNRLQTIKLDQVLVALSEARGGWRTLMLVGGAASTLGGLIALVIKYFVTKGVT